MKQARKYTSSIVDDLLFETSERTKKRVSNKMLMAAKIADAMSARGWNNNRLMEEMGKNTPSVVSKWLSGTHNFTMDTLSELEEVLEIRLLDLKEKKENTGLVFQVEVSQAVSKIHRTGGKPISHGSVFSAEFGKSNEYSA